MAIKIPRYHEYSNDVKLLADAVKVMILASGKRVYKNDYCIMEWDNYDELTEFPDFYMTDKSLKELVNSISIDIDNSQMSADEIYAKISESINNLKEIEKLIPEFFYAFSNICQDFLEVFIEDMYADYTVSEIITLSYGSWTKEHIRRNITDLIPLMVRSHILIMIDEAFEKI